jgi:hypothetical protein
MLMLQIHLALNLVQLYTICLDLYFEHGDAYMYAQLLKSFCVPLWGTHEIIKVPERGGSILINMQIPIVIQRGNLNSSILLFSFLIDVT